MKSEDGEKTGSSLSENRRLVQAGLGTPVYSSPRSSLPEGCRAERLTPLQVEALLEAEGPHGLNRVVPRKTFTPRNATGVPGIFISRKAHIFKYRRNQL